MVAVLEKSVGQASQWSYQGFQHNEELQAPTQQSLMNCLSEGYLTEKGSQNESIPRFGVIF